MGTITLLDLHKTVFIPCECRNEILVIEYDHETQLTDVAIYESMASFTHKLSLWQRIRYAFKTLFYGKPFSDQMILSRKQLKDLKSFLSGLDL